MREWEKNIRRVDPYVPGEQPKQADIIKLNTNENPYGPSPEVEKLVRIMDTDVYRKYPDPTAGDLINALANYHGVKPSQVFVGVGSDDVLGMCFMTFFNSDKEIVFPDISYSFYPVWAKLRVDDYLKENGGVVFPNPNAPTAILEDLESVEKIIAGNKDSIVIVDEAYIDFAPEGSSALSLIDKYDNLIVVRTFSKSRSMAGVRIGYAISNEKLIGYLNDVKYSYNSYTMNIPSILLGTKSVEDDEYFKATVQKIINTRNWFSDELKKLGFRVLDSSANFVFASNDKIPASEIFEKAKQKGIFFRYFNSERIDNFLRITIGTDDEMKKVVDFLKDIC